MELFEVKYEAKLLSSKEVRDSMNKCLPILCQKHNCECQIEVKKKWFWLHDVYTIVVIGEKLNISYVEKQIKHLTRISI